MMHNTAQGLASLGRNGDSMLVHMNPKEVAGLQSIAMAQGGSLSINPDTGLPEAFDLLGAIGSLAPVAAGFMFPGFGASLGLGSGIGAGALTGAVIAGLSGQDPLMGGLTGGFGGYGGSGLGQSAMAKAGTPASGISAATTNQGVTQQFLENANKGLMQGGVGSGAGSMGINASNITPTAQGVAPQGIQLPKATMPTELSTGYGVSPKIGVADPLSFDPSNLTKLPSADNIALKGGAPNFDLDAATKSLKSDPLGVIKDYGYGKTALMGGSALLAGLEPSDLYGDPLKSPKDKYDPYASLNLSGDTGLRLYAAGGDVYANQSSIASGGLQSLYGTSDSSGGRQPLSRDGYGIGRLENLTAEGSRAKAANTFYAGGGAIAFDKGGYLDGAGDGMSDSIPATIEGQQPARLADGEFVVPADVVSHLGNGSSKAGSKRLYSMLDKVRQARTGTKKQGKQIKANKYLPA
jgi:hypothetical protein